MEQHDPLALFLAKKWYTMYGSSVNTIHDFVQNARVGLLQAVQTYEPARHNAFSTWAAYKIRAEIQFQLFKGMYPIHVPRRKCKVVSIAMDMRDTTLENIEDDSKSISAFENECDAAVLMKDLTSQERIIVQMRYYEGATFKEIGEAFGYTHEWARNELKFANLKMAQVGVSPCHSCNWHNVCRDNNIKICPRDGKRTHYLDAKDE